MEDVIKILLQGFVAALAGYFGVKFGLSRFRGEKALEARLDWYRPATSHYAQVKWDIEVARAFMVEGEDWGRHWIKVRERELLSNLVDDGCFRRPFVPPHRQTVPRRRPSAAAVSR
jgi:hypothetical protein